MSNGVSTHIDIAATQAAVSADLTNLTQFQKLLGAIHATEGDTALGEQTQEVYHELIGVVMKACLHYAKQIQGVIRPDEAKLQVIFDSIRAIEAIANRAPAVFSIPLKPGMSSASTGSMQETGLWLLKCFFTLLGNPQLIEMHPSIADGIRAIIASLLLLHGNRDEALIAHDLVDAEIKKLHDVSTKPAKDPRGDVLVETDATALLGCLCLLNCKAQLYQRERSLSRFVLPDAWPLESASIAQRMLSADGPLLKEQYACQAIVLFLEIATTLSHAMQGYRDVFELVVMLLSLLHHSSAQNAQPYSRSSVPERFTASFLTLSGPAVTQIKEHIGLLCGALSKTRDLDPHHAARLLGQLQALNSSARFASPPVASCVEQLEKSIGIKTPERSRLSDSPSLAPIFPRPKAANPLLESLALAIVPKDANIDTATSLLASIRARCEKYDAAQMLFLTGSLGALACASSGTSTFYLEGATCQLVCPTCTMDQPGEELAQLDCQTESLLSVALLIGTNGVIQQDTALRIDFYRALKRIIHHADAPAAVALSSTVALAKLIASGLRDPSRHVRILAGQLAGLFFRYSAREAEEKIMFANRRIVMEMLQRITDTSKTETLLFAWVEVAKSAGPLDLLPMLSQFVEFLSHSNMLIRQSAVVGLQSLAEHAGCSPWALFSPYMRQISVQVLRKCKAQPQFISFFANLMGIHSTDFLVRNQQYLMPVLVMDGKVALIVEMASATRQSVNKLILDNAHFIISHMLTSSVNKAQLMSFFSQIDSKFADVKLNDLICSVPIPLAVELLQSVNETHIKRTMVHAALTFVATVSIKPPASTRKTPKEVAEELQKTFLIKHSLGIVGQFSEALNNAHGKKGVPEKIRIIRALYELMVLVEQSSESAVPQITVCLQAAILVPELRLTGLVAWHCLLTKSAKHVAASLISHSVCLFLHIWGDASDSERRLMRQMMELFVHDFGDAVAERIGQVPRVAVPELREVEQSFADFRKSATLAARLEQLGDLLQNDNPILCERGLLELKATIAERDTELNALLLKERKDLQLGETLRALLDIVAKHHGLTSHLQSLAADVLGMIGAVDPVRVDTGKDKSRAILLNSFMDEDAEETVAFVRMFLEDQLVEAFQSATNTKVQLSLAWAIQELLKFSGFDESLLSGHKEGFERDDDYDTRRRWRTFSASSRTVFAPLLSSKWDRPSRSQHQWAKRPVIQHAKTYRQWLHLLTLDLLQMSLSENAQKLFGVLAGILKEDQIEMANYLLPYLFLNGIFAKHFKQGMPGPETLAEEVRLILETTSEDPAETEKLRLATEAIFPALDYLQHWRRSRRNHNALLWAEKMKRQKLQPRPEDYVASDDLTQYVDNFFALLKPETLANGALRIRSYSRALYYWEQHIRNQKKSQSSASMEPLYATLQQLYINIDDPDGIEGVSANLRELTVDQEILMHENAGRWTAAQSSYEFALQRRPDERQLQIGLLNCLRQTGHYELLLEQAKSMLKLGSQKGALLDIAIESCWNIGSWSDLQALIGMVPANEQTYDALLGRFFLTMKEHNAEGSQELLAQLRARATNELASSNTDSLRQCYEPLAKLHIVHELDVQLNTVPVPNKPRSPVWRDRLALVADSGRWKQHILSVRRVTLELQREEPSARAVSHIWLQSSKLARKTGQTQQAYKAILHALTLKGTPLAEFEHARWWWKGGYQLRAIQTLRKALVSKVFEKYEVDPKDIHCSIDESFRMLNQQPAQMLVSKAQLLLTRWNDLAEHANSVQQLKEYTAAATSSQLEKPHYFLGRYYLRLLETEAKKPIEQQDDDYQVGQYHRHVVISYGKAIHFGTKYIFQTLPSYLQLWLDFGDRVNQTPGRISAQRRSDLQEARKAQLKVLNEKIKIYVGRLPTYLYMLAFPQILSRLNHSERGCYALLEAMLVKVLLDYPKQALWTFMAAGKSRDALRSQRGNTLIANVRREAKRLDRDAVTKLVQEAQAMTDQLMNLCMTPVVKNRATLSLTRDLHFDTACAPNSMVVPTQDNLTVILPSHSGRGSTKHHRAFEDNQPTVAAFSDEVDVMNSLQKPRKIVVRASNGELYPFLVKPNDDLRKDARLMDFNGVIQKFIRRDAEALKRTLRIRTYAVIALNEDHGLCEWVKNTRPLRDILIKTLKTRGISMAYGEIKTRLEAALTSSNPGHSFKLHVLDMYPPCFSEWFVEKFPDPSQWFTARLSYSRTLAVMSMVGFVLGLGDRHGENILFDETTGDAVHVDFNCLFEKGHTFEKPERVPFRLTQNLVDALGVTGVNGSFRKTCEITLRILRENQDAFNTVLESFLHDPVGEFLRKKKNATGDVEKEEARKVLSVIASKLKGSAGAGINDKHVPLSVEGQADELIKQATDDQLLVRMYIGWTAWL